MRYSSWIGALSVLCSVVAASAQDAAAPKTGSFETTFDQRSPHSEMKSLTKRLSITDATADYDLAKEPCLVFVPEKYDPAKPMGLIVLLNYKASDQLPGPVLPQLEEAYCAMVVPKRNAQPVWAKAGIALDAAHNMALRYKIDWRRVYAFGADAEDAAQRVSLNYPEVFTGGFWMQFDLYRPVKSQGNAFWNPKLPKPDPKALAVAKTHPFVLASHHATEQWTAWANAFKADGFKFINYVTLTQEQFHYPNYSTDWLPGVIQYLDAATAKLKPPATKPAAATKPSATAPARPR
jgi:hypothetical protein